MELKQLDECYSERAHYAVALKVPRSGIPELDAMIRESRRLDMATAAMQGNLANFNLNGKPDWYAFVSMQAADALLAASEKESGG